MNTYFGVFKISGIIGDWIRNKDGKKYKNLKILQLKKAYLIYSKYAFEKNCRQLQFQSMKMSIKQLNTW